MNEHFEMRCLLVFVIVLTSRSDAQNGRGPQSLSHNRSGWNIRLAVPGEPGKDYLTLSTIPRTSFSCAGKKPGYYADVDAGCQVFRVCTIGSTYGFQSFLCPNGTLFNQDVFVCDWWMNVKCQNYARLTTTNEKFSNLRLGPQLMKDIKKMLTHTMRNSYDKTAMKSNLVVMQDYKPPPGQLFPNGALLAGPERNPNNIYVPAKQIQSNFNQNFGSNDISFAASTPDTRYVPAAFTTQPRNDAEVFQRQRQSAQYVQQNNIKTTQPSQSSNIFQNGHSEPNTYSKNREVAPNTQLRLNQNYIQQKAFGQKTNTAQNIQRGLNRQQAQYVEAKKTQFNGGNQNAFNSYTKQQYNQQQQEKQPYTYKAPIQSLPKNVNGISRDLKQNLVSTIPTSIPTQSFLNGLQNSNSGRPKSRITIKTWIVKPSKSGRLIAEPSSYVYNRPTKPPAARIIDEKTPYVYNRPTSPPQQQKIVTQEDPQPYVYNPPTTPTPARIITKDVEPYFYNKPTLAPKQIVSPRSEPSRGYLPPEPSPTSRPSQPALLIQTSTSSQPTQPSRVVLVPTTFKPIARLYLPPPASSPVLSRQYLSPISQVPFSQGSQLRAAPTTPTPTYALPSNNNVNSPNPVTNNNKNLTFTEILTKEKLDLTVNDIVKDTGNILQTASPPEFGEYRQNIDAETYPDDKYLPANTDDESGENLTSQSPSSTSASKSARLTALPSRNLEPPVESPVINSQNTNQLSKLPFFKEPAIPNTIERTVSLKITIPERVASYLFKGGNDTDFDKLEILNTGSSNYLVLSNNYRDASDNSISLGNLGDTKTSNISQALVFSILADSLNAAKKYNNLVKQNALSSTTPTPPLQNINDEDISQISNKISQLTSSQYSIPNTLSDANQVNTLSSTSNDQTRNNQYKQQINSVSNQIQQTPSAQYNIAPSIQTQKQISEQYQDDNEINGYNSKQNQIYSGQLYQLPVPEVTSQFYNIPQPANLIQQADRQKNKQITDSTQISRLNNVVNHNNLVKQSNAEVEIVHSQTLPLNSAKLQLAPTNEPESFYSQESLNSLLNSDNGISAQLQDKIVGIIPHPLEDNKVVTYEKDQSYYLYTKLNNNGQTISPDTIQTNNNLRFLQESKPPNVITFQFVPSVSYQLEDEKEQQKLLNTFQIDEFGAPREVTKANLVQDTNQQRGSIVSNIDYTIQHPSSNQVNGLSRVDAIYKGPSSYSAPQGSVGNLARQTAQPNNGYNAKIEELNESSNSEGYPKSTPTRRFIF